MDWDDVENVDGLALKDEKDFETTEEKYGVNVQWYKARAINIHILERYDSSGLYSDTDTEIYLADTLDDAKAVYRELVTKTLEVSKVDDDDRQRWLEELEKYGGARKSLSEK